MIPNGIKQGFRMFPSFSRLSKVKNLLCHQNRLFRLQTSFVLMSIATLTEVGHPLRWLGFCRSHVALNNGRPRAKVLYFDSTTGHSSVTAAVTCSTMLLGCLLEMKAFSFIFCKNFVWSEYLMFGSCICSRVVKRCL